MTCLNACLLSTVTAKDCQTSNVSLLSLVSERRHLDMHAQRNPFSMLDYDHNTFLRPYGTCVDESAIKRHDSYLYQPHHLVDGVRNCELLISKINWLCEGYGFQESSQRTAIKVIVKFLSSLRDRRLFKNVKMTVAKLRRKDPKALLKLVNYVQSEIYEKVVWKMVFRLSGLEFPPKIVYKLVCVCPYVNVNDVPSVPPLIRQRAIAVKEWETFCVYRCSLCKTTVKSGPRHLKTKKKSNNKQRNQQHSLWIDQVYLE